MMPGAILGTMAKARILGKSPVGAWLRLTDWIWRRLPRQIAALRPVDSYGRFLHSLALHADREMYLGTFFFRNRPELELIRRLSDPIARRRPVKIAVLGCSNGAEVYSIRWTLRSMKPGTQLVMHAVDISTAALECREMFDGEGKRLAIKPRFKEGITWLAGDAGDPRMRDALGSQDIVVANRFLCHMAPPEAERCLRSTARLLGPGGHLFVSGIDLDVRTKVARELGWKPVQDLLEGIHDGDRSLRADWPCKYWGLEPLDKRRPDWAIRYASVFQIGEGD